MSAIFFLLVFFLTAAQAQGVRRMLLFAGDSTNADLKTQRQWLQADTAGVVQRDIWIAVFTDPKTFRRMYDHHDADRDEFTLVLMRKDGTEQMRSEKPLTTKELFEIIDTAPAQVIQTGGQQKKDQNK